MSIVWFGFLGSVIWALALLAIVEGIRSWRRKKRATDGGIEPWTTRVLFAIPAPFLAFAIVAVLLVLFVAGPCGMGFAIAQGTILLMLGGFLIPLLAAVLTFALALRYGRLLVLVECALGLLCALVVGVYASIPSQIMPGAYESSSRCQVNGP